MRVFKLELRDNASSGAFHTTLSPGPLIVAARREEAARRVAQLVFGIAVAKAVGAPAPLETWTSSLLSCCRDITDAVPQISAIRRLEPDGMIAVADATLPDNSFYGAELLWWPVAQEEDCPV